MNGSNLSVGMFGEGVKHLQDKLRQHGFDIPAGEIDREFFGPATRRALMECQQQHGLDPTGVLDERSGAALDAAITARAPTARGAVPAGSSVAPPGATAISTASPVALGASLPPVAVPPAPSLPAAATALASLPVSIPLPGGFIPGPNPNGAGDTTPGAPPATDSRDGVFLVRGLIRHADGSPVSGVLVVAVDRDLRGEEALGQATTNRDGQYQIQYNSDQFARAEKRSADLVVRAMDAAGAVLAASPILFNAPPEATIDLVVELNAPGVLSEFERLLSDLEPLLVNVVVPGLAAITLTDKLADLKPDEIEFLVSETGIEQSKIAFLVASAVQQKKAVEQQASIPAAAFYGLAREGLPLDLAALGLRSQKELRDAIRKAIDQNIVPTDLRGLLDQSAGQLQELGARSALQVRAGDTSHSLSELLGSALASSDQQSALLKLAANNVGSPQEFWKALGAHPDFQSAGTVEKIQLTMQLGLLTQNHAPLIQELRRTSEIKNTRDLVKLDAAAWKALVNREANGKPIGIPPGVPGATPQERTANYVNRIVGLLQAAFPSETVAQILAQADSLNLGIPARQSVSKFFSNSPGFDLRTSHVDTFVAENGAAAFDGIAEADKPTVISQVKRLQRAFQVSTSAETMATLLSRGLDSAHAIANIPRKAFLAQHAIALGSERQAIMIHERAQHINARNLQLYVHLNDALNGVQTMAIGGWSEEAKQVFISRRPSYAELFGSLDLCECKHCRSVLSPAAYFVDLLEFLRHSTPNTKNKTPLDILFERRPDLEHITLTCENTNTTLPYVDLVNEVLESYVTYLLSRKTQQPQKPSILAHDTGDATPQELDANPQNTNEDAYREVAQAVYPLTLPSNQPVEVARAYLQHLGISRQELLTAFEKEQSVKTDRATHAEYLGITLEEYQILTGANFDPAVQVSSRPLREYYGYDADQIGRPEDNPTVTRSWKEWLSNVPEFLQRTGISYVDLTEALKTRLINPAYPEGEALEFFRRIPLSFATLAGLVQGNFANPPQKVLDALQRAGTSLQQLIDWSNANFQGVRKMIVLDAPDSKCDLSVTRLQQLDGSLLDDAELSKLHRFIRLWRKIGWRIATLDRAMTALGASDVTLDLLIQLAEIKQLQDDLGGAKIDVLLSLWAPINTHGDDSLYKKLFLNKATLRIDDVFKPKPDGSVLSDPGLKLSEHIPALVAALRISAAELALIRADAQLDAETAQLNLANVSALYRYSALAHGMKLRVGDLLALKTLSGINPFAGPDKTVEFATIATRMQESDFKLAQLSYLYRHLTAPPTNLAPQAATLLLLARVLRDGLTKIAQDNALAPDPTGEFTRARLGLLFDSGTADQTIAMINCTAVYSAPLAQLPSGIVFPDLVKNKISYDRVTRVLRFTGAMTTAEQGALLSASRDSAYRDAVKSLFEQPAAFIKNALSGFLDVMEAEKNLVRDVPSLDQDLKPIMLDLNGNPTVEPAKALETAMSNKFAYVLGRLLPYLRKQLSHTFVKQTIADALKLDSATVQDLVETVLESPANPQQPAIADLVAMATPGLTASYFTSNDLSGKPAEQTDSTIAFDGGGTTLPPGTRSASWSGMLLAPNTGVFTFSLRPSGNVQLWVGDKAKPLALHADSSTNELVSDAVNLKAAQLYDLRLEATSLPLQNAVVELRWQSAAAPKGIILSDNLYPRALLDNLSATLTRLHKAALIVTTFRLTGKEIEYLAAHGTDFDNFDLNLLPLARDPATAAQIDQQAVTLFKAWQRLNDFVKLRDSLPRGEVSLIDVFGATSAGGARLKLQQATGWDPVILSSLADSFKLPAAAFKNEIWLTRLQSCMRLIRRMGISAQQVVDSTSLDADFARLADIAQEIKKAVRAKYDEETWLTVAKPLNDVLREKQRDALVAYLLPRLAMDDANQLFEYFLIDAEMSACMATSRIKQAISSVQLFIQRCLVNLEENDNPLLSVSPAAIDAEQWEWMKHYRVWEANRKIFVHTETWLEEALRDGKSPFFKQLESELLQNDLTQDTAKTAFLNYLEKLDQVARLEICGMYWEDKDADTGEEVNVLHVFGRTFHAPRVYYYRRLTHTREWTAWEQVQADIQGDHLIPVVWKRRLYIFWPVFTQKAKPVDVPKNINPQAPIPTHVPEKYWEIKLAWSEYKQNSWSPKRLSEQALNLTPEDSFKYDADQREALRHYVFRTEINRDGNGREMDLLVRCEYHRQVEDFDGEGRTTFINDMVTVGAFDLTGCTGASINVESGFPSFYDPITPAGADFDAMTFVEKPRQNNLTLVGQDAQQPITFLERTPTPYTLLYPHQYGQYILQAPFFYQDSNRTFFVEPYEAVNIVEQIIDYNTIDASQYFHRTVGRVNALVANNGFTAANREALALMSLGGGAILNRLDTSPSVVGESAAPAALTRAPMSAASSSFNISDWSTTAGARQNWSSYNEWSITTGLKFDTFRHPYVTELIKSLNREDVPGLLTVGNQALGIPYRHSPWRLAYWGQTTAISDVVTGPACIIQGDFGPGPVGNFEAVLLEGGNLVHYWRDNSKLDEPWQRGDVITSNATGPAWLNQSDWQTDGHGHLEVVALEGSNLVHYFRDDTGWHRDPDIITSNATGAGCIIQSDYGGGGHGRYDALALEGSKLLHYWHDNRPQSAWQRDPDPITSKATSPGCIIQSDYLAENGHGKFEVVVCEGSDLAHYTFDGPDWHRDGVITSNATGAGCIIQSNIRDGVHGNFECVVPEGKYLVHYWRDNSQENPRWQRGQVVASTATGPACLIQSAFGKVDGFYGNFEVAALEGNRLVHYWNSNNDRFLFDREYSPGHSQVGGPYPVEDVDFRYGGPYSLYNWELFFHAPMLIATHLSRNQGCRDAMRWFHYVFNPMDDSYKEPAPARYWKVLPFKTNVPERLEDMMMRLSKGDTELLRQVDDWRHHPFQPHRIGRMRLAAYQKSVVMKYIENLICRGDQLFRLDTVESINEATQCYVLAAKMSPRPEHLPMRGTVAPEAYVTLKDKLDAFGNTISEFQNDFPYSASVSSNPTSEARGLLGVGPTLYFCIPQNDKLLSYWDTVADRLFKVRHCMNIEGVVRQLPLFDPPIDPALLVQAAAQGVDLSSVLNDMSAPLPYYRFSYVLQKALELCNDVKALGNALLAALEKKDAEHLSYVRAQHETGLLHAIRQVKEAQVAETASVIEGLRASRRVAVERCQHYGQLLEHNFNVSEEPNLNVDNLEGKTKAPDFYIPRQLNLQQAGRGEVEGAGAIGTAVSAAAGLALGGPGGAAGGAAAGQAIGAGLGGDLSVNMNSGANILAHESDELKESYTAAVSSINAAALDVLSSSLSLLPNFEIATKPLGAGGAVHYGSTQLAGAPAAAARVYHAVAAWHQYKASLSGRMASFVWREHDWGLQGNLAAREIEQIDKQIVGAMIRREIARRELDNHDRQIANAEEVEQVLSTKVTREALYDWMQQKLASLYSDSYQMSYDLAKKAEKAFRFERGLTTSSFIQFGYWDSLRKGLLAGEQLYLGLKQMERAYLDQNKRDYEITRNISLVLHDPMALIALKETGQCEVELPEALFDADYPGHYMRRVKSVSLTIPCVVGPYTSINCTLTLLSNKTRVKSTGGPQYLEREGEDDDRFVTNFAAMQSIATSHAQNDSGMFELNFRDERYLPFEGAGVVSRWRIELPKDTNAFEFDTLTDVVIHLKYTAREGGEILKTKAKEALRQMRSGDEATPLPRFFSLKHEFPTDWYRFLRPADPKAGEGIVHSLQVDLSRDRFPFQFRSESLTINSVRLFLKLKEGFAYDDAKPLGVRLEPRGSSSSANAALFQVGGSPIKGLPIAAPTLDAVDIPAQLTLKVRERGANRGDNGELPASGAAWLETVRINGEDHRRLSPDAIDDIWIVCASTRSSDSQAERDRV